MNISSREYPNFIIDPRIAYGDLVKDISASTSIESLLSILAKMLPLGENDPALNRYRKAYNSYNYPIGDPCVLFPTATFASFGGVKPHKKLKGMFTPSAKNPATIHAANMIFVAWHSLQHIKRALQNDATFTCPVVSPDGIARDRTVEEAETDLLAMMRLEYVTCGIAHPSAG